MQIREKQMVVFQQAAERNFAEELLHHFREFAPRLCDIVGEPAILAVIQSGIERAKEYGFTNRGPVQFFLELMFTFGSGFDTDPQLPWAAQILNEPGDQMVRADRLYRKMEHFLDHVAGPENRYAIDALRKIMQAGPADIPSGGDFEAKALGRLREVYPQKCKYVGEPAVEAVIARAIESARKLAITGEEHLFLLVGLLFGFGHGALEDPLYPWIGATLSDSRVPDPNARAKRLSGKTRVYIESMLAHLS